MPCSPIAAAAPARVIPPRYTHPGASSRPAPPHACPLAPSHHPHSSGRLRPALPRRCRQALFAKMRSRRAECVKNGASEAVKAQDPDGFNYMEFDKVVGRLRLAQLFGVDQEELAEFKLENDEWKLFKRKGIIRATKVDSKVSPPALRRGLPRGGSCAGGGGRMLLRVGRQLLRGGQLPRGAPRAAARTAPRPPASVPRPRSAPLGPAIARGPGSICAAEPEPCSSRNPRPALLSPAPRARTPPRTAAHRWALRPALRPRPRAPALPPAPHPLPVAPWLALVPAVCGPPLGLALPSALPQHTSVSGGPRPLPHPLHLRCRPPVSPLASPLGVLGPLAPLPEGLEGGRAPARLRVRSLTEPPPIPPIPPIRAPYRALPIRSR